jgi:hypothetical protein
VARGGARDGSGVIAMDESPAPKPARPRTSLVRREWRLLMMWLKLACAMACAGAQALAWFTPVRSIGDYGDAISFKIAMWRASPDSMTYTETDGAGHLLFTYTTSKPSLVKQWFAYVNDETPIGAWGGCSGFAVESPPVYRTYTFSARGVIIERATAITGTTVCQFEYRLSAGAAHDPFLYFLSDPHDSPSPPPVGHQEVP